MPQWTIGAVLDAIAEVIPDHQMTVCGPRRSTFAESAARTNRLANYLHGNGFGVHKSRETLQRWECGQDRVALIMYNDLYPDMVIGCLKARVVPVNVNHHYSPREIAELLDYVKPRAVIYHRSLGARFAEVLPPHDTELLISIDDASGAAELPGAVSLDDALATCAADRTVAGSPDDLIMMCTGGTTGRPKGVLWRQSDIYVTSMVGADHAGVEEIHQLARVGGPPWFAVSPLMHAAGMWTAFAALLHGLTVVMYDDRNRLDARSVWATAEREQVGMITMVGDAYAAPLVDELRNRTYHLSSVHSMGTGGAATNAKYKRALMELLPQATIIEGYGSSETGNMAFGYSRDGTASETFEPRIGATVVSADRSRFLRPGEPEIGWAARIGRIPLGYFDDAEATQRTFPEIAGQRVVIPGDRACLEKDGTIRLFGRDSLVVNTGGEKVFVEEVEDVLRAHPGVADALVLGRPSERWGQEVVALVVLRPDAPVGEPALYAFCTSQLAHFKAPKAFIVVEHIQRLGNGKPNYRWAREQVTRRVPAP
ncbi:acyl-CoA synthetase [Mycobacterium persicum]|uniref:Acyl-CoA synthetase n=1 Tax=Mycobacterium persicum TaxID=1487726 RepID=A0A1X0L669_9MYCO|nr:acyl-CoA synthetase [Mycobacterium persicum]KZS82732.1 acyl-CoA synthetase [Mycobacterium persicum]ORB47080.1 acyl-CoA synthetase [Mycobacterium persicum]ORB88816.1 acyl-CoA synthetase [Mycobacterium persicum]ORB94190.1 acyl-CoA synthetase [Mycobacterium persicum]ORC06284.1 acyl-CoA synthetase [Mycobacterium persicum]